ncbi:putative quinol monooxygenase [Nonomuraea candida]|uniref:putative quinol monooxygenase n=1 Tax=Nonomuraea candida TaxID=359159 RepID=UPI001FDECE63|nr:antibiotic biosynthesis monooxygenase [Nonomuraea candida]
MRKARHEPGTIVYASHRVDGQPLQRIFYELYRDRDAFDAHEQTEQSRRFLRPVKSCRPRWRSAGWNCGTEAETSSVKR